MVSALFTAILVASSVPNALHDAVISDDLEALQAAIKSGASPEDRDALGYTVLMRAADDGALDAARMLVAAGVLVNARDNSKATALHLASEGGFTELVQLLIDQAAPPPLHRRAQAEAQPSLAILQPPTTARQPPHDPLTLTRYRRRSRLNGCFRDQGAEIEAADQFEWTALHAAASRGHTEVLSSAAPTPSLSLSRFP